jgi:PAS domain-containing protein
MADPVHLLVDEPGLRETIVEHLRECGFIARNGTDACELHVHAKRAASSPRPSLPERIDGTQIRRLFDSVPVRIALHDRDYRLRYVNREVCSFFGKPASAFLGQTPAELCGDETWLAAKPFADRALAVEGCFRPR